MLRPFRAYAALAAEAPSSGAAWLFVRGPMKLLLTLGVFVSITTAARIVWPHVALAFIAWAFAPLMQMTFVVAVAGAFRSKRRAAELVDLYFVGQGPWLLLLCALSGICLFAPEVWPVFRWLLSWNVLLVALVVTILWSGTLTAAFFRHGAGLGRGATAGATAAFYLAYFGALFLYYLVTGQLAPILGAG